MNFKSKRQIAKCKSIALASLAVALLVSFAGCNSGQLPTYPVQGTIRFEDGSNVRFGDIEFYSVDHRLNARGKVNRDGKFTVTTYSDGDGAVAGTHKIVVLQITGSYLTAGLADQIEHDHGELIHSKYFDYRTSGLECTIEPGENPVELVVQKNPRQTEDGLPED